MCGSLLKSTIGGDVVSAVDLSKVEVGEIGNQTRNISARGIDLNRHRDGVAVVFDDKDDRKPFVRGGIERFPELSLRGGTFADGDVDALVAVELDVAPGAVISLMLFGCFGMTTDVSARFGAADGVQALSGGRGGLRDDVESGTAPMRRHLASAARRVGSGPYSLQQQVFHGSSEREAESAVAIVGEEPVVARLQHHAGRDDQGFMAGAGDLKKDLLLTLEHDLAIVCAAREIHQPVDFREALRSQRRD